MAVPLASVFAARAQFVPNNKFSRHFGRSSDQFVWSFRDNFAGGSDLLSVYLTSPKFTVCMEPAMKLSHCPRMTNEIQCTAPSCGRKSEHPEVFLQKNVPDAD